MPLRDRVWDYCGTEGLLAPGDRVVVGVSGGPDSLCLLDLLHHLAGEQGLSLTVAHLDHRLRPVAADEAEFVRAQAAARHLACLVAQRDVGRYAAEQGLSLEAAGRRLRYAFLLHAARRTQANRIAVAHTADDQAETVLMHFLRGSGLAGLQGMRPTAAISEAATGRWDGGSAEESAQLDGEAGSRRPPIALIRPLLAEPRAAVLAYCHDRDLRPRHDETNQDRRYWRNRVRHEVLPYLERHNPNLCATLARTAEVLAGDYALLRRAVDGLMERTAPARWQTKEEVVWDRTAWRDLTRPEQRALLRRGIERLRGAVRDVGFDPLDAAARFSGLAHTGQTFTLPGGLRLKVKSDRLVLAGKAAARLGAGGPLLDAGGRLADGWRIEVEALAAGAWQWTDVTNSAAWEVYVDAARVPAPLEVRRRRPGERFQPLGLGGHSDKVSDHMINAKLDAALRDRWPVVACGPVVVWLPGLRLDDRFKVTAETRAALRLRFIQATDELEAAANGPAGAKGG
ncbi:MAG: tRNA lysidine(34) synthetase TilS [Anaerolineales bacterium]|nr:tRNA lysidine(34) synthetase TilS [Anaerolineales bacterium]